MVVVEGEVCVEDNLVVSLVSVILDESEDEGLIVVVVEDEVEGGELGWLQKTEELLRETTRKFNFQTLCLIVS